MSNSLTPYLELLVQLREDLADNLAYMGVSVEADEPLKTLVPKVLQIYQGDPSQELWSAQMQQLTPSYGFFSTGEVANLAGICKISLCNRITSATVTISGSESVAALTVTAPGWSVSRGATTITITRSVLCKAELERALEQISIASDDSTEVLAQITVSVTFLSGATATASGSTELKYSYSTTWLILEDVYGYTWQGIEDANLTWEQMENLGKPEDT